MSVVRNAMAAQIGDKINPFLRSMDYREDTLNPPVGIVVPPLRGAYVDYVSTLEGDDGFLGNPAAGVTLASHNFNLDYMILLAKANTQDRVEENLDAWLGVENDGTAVSVVAAVLADPTLGGVVDWCVPLTADSPGPITWAGLELFGTRIHFSLSA